MWSIAVRASRLLPGALALFLAVQAWAAGPAPTVRVQGGRLSGLHDASTGLDQFRGIPFAAPPVGALRWKPLQPVAAWTGQGCAGSDPVR